MSRHELTARIAYEIYVQRGFAPGRHREDWAAAEAIVELCLAFATELLQATDEAGAATEAPSEPGAGASPAPTISLEERALALLTEAAAELGRAAVARKLGYKSASTVGRYVRGDRPIGAKLAARILGQLTPTASQAIRRAA